MSANFNHKDLLQGYDMVACITVKAINDQMADLFQKGLIHQNLDLVFEKQGNPLDPTTITYELLADLGAPTITILDGSNNARMVEFTLNMPSGSLGVKGAQERINFKNWKYVFNVNLDMQAISVNDLKEGGRVPTEVTDHLSKFDNEMFTIQHLFMDFEDADLANFNSQLSSCPLPGGIWGTGDLTKPGTLSNPDMKSSLVELQMLLRDYFTGLKGTNNPYILGYTVTANNALNDNTIPPTFNPTGCNFSVSYNATNPDETSTLNFLIKTDGAAIPSQPGDGIFPTPWVNSTSNDGAFIVGEDIFMEKWLLPKLVQSLQESVGGGTLSQTDTGWKLTYSADMTGIPDITGNSGKGTESYEVDITVSNDTNGIAKINLTGNYSSYIKWRWQVWPLEYEVDAWANQTWTGTVAISVNGVGEINTNFTQNVSPPTHDYSKNGPAKFLNIISFGTLRDFIDNMGSASANTFNHMASQFGTNLYFDLQTRFVMPAGKVFKFSNLEIDSSGNIITDVDYTSEAEG